MWEENDNKLEKIFEFADFAEALTFVNEVGELSEQLEHHPDICIQNYNQVLISTTTHDDDFQITEKDHELAAAIDELSGE